MRIITALSELDGTYDPAVERLVRQRLDMLAEFEGELARFIVVEPGDSLAAIEQEVGFPFATPAWEWIAEHGGLFEAPFILSDDGYAHVLIVPDREGIEPTLLTLCRTQAEPADDSTP